MVGWHTSFPWAWCEHGVGSAQAHGGGEDEHAPKLLHSEPYSLTNAALPDHAQRMRSLFASDSPSVPCGVGREACEEGRHAGWEAGGHVQAARRQAPTVGTEGRARAERTVNMYRMFVTLDVSKISGWLNADASCRVEREA